MVPHPPDMAFETLRKPQNRQFYDEILKVSALNYNFINSYNFLSHQYSDPIAKMNPTCLNAPPIYLVKKSQFKLIAWNLKITEIIWKYGVLVHADS